MTGLSAIVPDGPMNFRFDLDEWKKYPGDIPAGWINAYDPTPDNAITRLYDLKAIPSLYLLDKDKITYFPFKK